jgi:hypothetical protein
MCHVSAMFDTHSRGVLGLGVAHGSSDAGFEMLGRTLMGGMFACWVRKSWSVMFKSAKLLSRCHSWASSSEMGEVSEAMVYGWYGSGGKFAGGPKSHRKVRSYLKKLRLLTSWPGYLTTFSPPRREYSSVRATLQSKPEARYLPGKTKVIN